MYLSDEQTAAIVMAHREFILTTVNEYLSRNELDSAQWGNDLTQIAYEQFLRNLRRARDLDDTIQCTDRIVGAFKRYRRQQFFLKVSSGLTGKEFAEVRSQVSRVEYIEELDERAESHEAGTTSGLDMEAFLEGLKPNERKAVRMKAYDGATNRALIPVLGVKNEVDVARFFKRLRKRAEAYLLVKEDQDGDSGLRG